jgi:hypothetical protein
MLMYQEIVAYNQARRRLSNSNYAWLQIDHTRESDKLLAFTAEKHARIESQHNFNWLIQQARELGASVLVFTPNIVQLLGRKLNDRVLDTVWCQQWQKDYQDFLNREYRTHTIMRQDTDLGSVAVFRDYNLTMTMPEYQGVYDVGTEQRMTNRRHTIEVFWQYGFTARRGRPLNVGDLNWSGQRNEIEEMCELADRYWDRTRNSEVARKFCSAYTSINRYHAWPGHW